MARSKVITLNDKKVTIKELRMIQIKEDVLPKIFGIMEGVDLKDMQVVDLIPLVAEKISDFVPDVTPDDIENAYPSEIEELIQAYIEVNFGGLKKMLIPALKVSGFLGGLAKTGIQAPQ